MFWNIVLPFFFGILLVGAMMERTLTVLRGNVTATAALSVLISITYWFNIEYVASGNIPAYVSFAAGTMCVTCYQSWREKQRPRPPVVSQEQQ